MLVAVSFGTMGAAGATRVAPRAHGGVLDLHDWDFERDGTLTLDGEWPCAESFALPREK